MLKTNLKIDGIPAILWGGRAERLFIAVHGAMGSKHDFAQFAEIACAKGCQVLSFDLPEHGERQNSPYPLTPPNAVSDLGAIIKHARTLSNRISLFACSIGAWFSLLAYADEPLEQCLFQSPVVDMARLIRNMMKAAGVSEEQLQREKVIANPYGPRFEWDYYHYVMQHPIQQWNAPTSILMGSEDEVSEVSTVLAFADKFNATLQLLKGSPHYLHTDEEAAAIKAWIDQTIP